MAISSSVHGTYLIDLVVLVVIIWRVSEPVEPTLLFMYRVLFSASKSSQLRANTSAVRQPVHLIICNMYQAS